MPGRAHRTAKRCFTWGKSTTASARSGLVRAIEVFDEDRGALEQIKLFAAERSLPEAAPDGVQVRLRDFELHRPRQWGACWLFTLLWKELRFEEFWRPRLGCSREGTDWKHVLQTLCSYRLLDPGSEWRLHRVWFDQSAMGDLLGEDFSIAAKDTLYRCLLAVEAMDVLYGSGDFVVRHKWLAQLVGFRLEVQKEIRAGRRNVGALKLSNLLQLDRFEKDLNISQVRLHAPSASADRSSHSISDPPPPTANQQRLRQQARAAFLRFREQIRSPRHP